MNSKRSRSASVASKNLTYFLSSNDSAQVLKIQRVREAVMATRKRATGKTKAKRKRTHAKASTRKKTTTVRKTRPITKKTPRKASLQGVSPRKAKPISATPKPVSPTPTPHRPQPVPAEQRIAVVTHYYSHLSVALLCDSSLAPPCALAM